MTKTRTLTGITTTGTPHLGNYVGAIRPAIAACQDQQQDFFFFLADYHALIKCRDPDRIAKSTKAIAATWLALGLNTEQCTFYRQSDVPEISELCWILQCFTAKGLMNRAHAYKAAVQINKAHGDDVDKAVTMGLFSYPVLMAADILLFNGSYIPVGHDQQQHVEMARDIAQTFNHNVNETIFTLPTAVVADDQTLLPGLDGRKMSKSYDNIIALFDTGKLDGSESTVASQARHAEKALQKAINKITTNSLLPGQPKETEDSTLFTVWQAFANQDQQTYMREQFTKGIAWGQAKKELFALINEQINEARVRYYKLMADPAYIEETLLVGAKKARRIATEQLSKVKKAVGIWPVTKSL
jgi:tryptophanyl-tRNA synthetase